MMHTSVKLIGAKLGMSCPWLHKHNSEYTDVLGVIEPRPYAYLIISTVADSEDTLCRTYSVRYKG